eukprot:jgi/Antlo1/2107/2304
MEVAENSFKEEWDEHFRDLMADIGGCVRSLELIGPDCTSIVEGDVKALDTEKAEIRDFALSSSACSRLTYGGRKYVLVQRRDDKMLPRPFFILMSLESIHGDGKRGMLVTDYYSMVLVATFDNSKLANSVNTIIKCIIPAEEDEE